MYSFYAWLSSKSYEPIAERRDNIPDRDHNPIYVSDVNGDIYVRCGGYPIQKMYDEFRV